jgi:PAS domain S-box-containing protein
MDKKLKFLHLEDSLSDAELVCKTLRKGGIDFEIKRIDTKDQFSAILLQFKPDIIFSTHLLPSFNSFEAIAILKDAQIEIPFILISDNSSAEFVIECMHQGADDYILKDNLQRLPGAIARVLEKYRGAEEHKLVTDNLILNEKRFLALIKNGDGGMTILSESGKPTFHISDKEVILGYSHEDMSHFNLHSLVHPDDVLSLKEILKKVYDNPGMQVKTEGLRMLHKDGSWLWIEGALTNMHHDPDINGIVVNFRNVTDRKLAENQILINERKYRRLIENSSDAIVILSAEGKPTYISPSLERVTGYTVEESLNIDLMSLIHPEEAHVLLSALEKTFASPGIPLICKAMRMRHKNGNWRWMEGIFTNLLDDPDINGIVDNFWDITERVEAEEKKLHANRLYAFISQINQAIVRTTDDQTLFNDTCKIAVDYGKFNMAWIGLVDPNAKRIRAVASYGASIQELNIFKDYAYDVFGPIEKVVQGQDFYVVNNLLHEQKKAWNIIAKEKGYKSAIVLALKEMDKVIGTLNIYSTEIEFFDQEEVELLVGASEDICFALEVFEKDRLRSQAEQDLSQSQSQLLIAQRIARLSYWETNAANRSVFWTDEIYNILGRDKETFKLTSESFIQVIHPDDMEMCLAQYKALTTGLKDLDMEYRILLPDGSIKWVHEQGNRNRDEQYKDIEYKGTVQDIDKLKRAELEILNIYEEKNIILESIGDAFFAVDANWNVNYWNREAERLLECPRERVLNKDLWDVFSKETYKESYDNYLQAFVENSIRNFETYFEATNRWLEITVYPSLNGLSVYFKDITGRKLADLRSIELNNELQTYTQELLVSNKELEQFSYILSHNLRAPVANIMGIAEVLKDTSNTEETKEMLNASLSSCIHLLNDVIIDLNTILTVKKETSERKEMVRVSDLIASIQTSIQNLIQAEHVQITVNFNELNEVFTLKSYLYSIFFNLISNSIKYHQPGIPPEIEIKSETSGKHFIITFKDNGMGIDLIKYKNQLFGLYKRFHPQIQGKGMGLFMVKTQVESLNGKIVIHSEPNKGTEFVMTFPLENLSGNNRIK